MHIGVLSSSLGPRLGDACDPAQMNGTLSAHNDDKAHLLNRGGTTEAAVADAGSGNFLAWFPTVKENSGKQPSAGAPAITASATLQKDFQDLVIGVHQFGCGLESQLENWYRFLIQPDPYDHLEIQSGKAAWVGVDTTILAQRHDFLRPDSLVAIIVLTDENDSEIDVRSLGQQGYYFMSTKFNPPRGTQQCSNPADPGCTSCQFVSSSVAGSDPNCQQGGYSAPNDWGYDLNLRHVHMKAKYGVDPQFPIQRYVTGLSSPIVPDRNGEYTDLKSGAVSQSYIVGQNNCTNPLFAAALPDGSKTDVNSLCKLQAGSPRTKDLVFYAHIGGVPHELLHFDPNSSKNSTLSDADWVKILGQDPLKYNYTGIDPHMIESYQPRTGLPAPSAADNADPINGREWVTDQGNHADLIVDREYACTFPISPARDCTDPANKYACDCSTKGLTHEQTPPVCDTNNPNSQVKAKAYPTIRELTLGRLMGTQGIISSICPIHVTEQGTGDPLYGYRPAVSAIVDRLKNALTNQCLPQKLTADASGNVPCLILATLPTAGGEDQCAQYPGLSAPGAESSPFPNSVYQKFRQSQQADFVANGGTAAGLVDPSTLPVCAVNQIVTPAGNTCKGSATPGWCYVTGGAAGTCAQEILFTSGTPPTGSQISLQCIEQQSAGSDGGAGGAATD
jgi:hypothetical protein